MEPFLFQESREEFTYRLIPVINESGETLYAYTTGLWAYLRHPELMVCISNCL